MIGNDIIDLKLSAVQSNWRRKGFLDKVFSTSEKEVILASENPGLVVWLLWSMKEAAYKAHQRRFLLPRRLNWKIQECSIFSFSEAMSSGSIRIENSTYFSDSVISEEMIHTSAVANQEGLYHEQISTGPGKAVKTGLLASIANVFSVESQSLQLMKDQLGIPVITRNGHHFFSDFSLSGHGRFSAFSFSLTNS